MMHPVYLVRVIDDDGFEIELDINNTDDLGLLISTRNLLSDSCRSIREQLSLHGNVDSDWYNRAKIAIKKKESGIRAVDRRIKFLQDPTGEIRAKNREFDENQRKASIQRDLVLSFLESNHKTVFEDVLTLLGENK